VILRPWEALLGPEHFVKGRLLVVAPHPDDESIGCGGLIAAHAEAGAKTRVVVMTDGGEGDPTGRHSGEGYSKLRRAETEEAARRLGGAEVVFLDHRDGALKDAASAKDDLLREIVAFEPSTVAFPSPFEIHQDHRAAAYFAKAAILEATPPPGRLLAYEIGGFMPANALLHMSAFAARKDAAIGAYASQLAHMDIQKKVAALNHARTVNVADRAVVACEAYCRLDRSRLEAYFAAAEAVLKIVDAPSAPS
jgi:N-acetylglucosamine malate deacetylase 1